MPISAVPAYLGKDFSDASPGLRFGLLLPAWEEQDFTLAKKGSPLLPVCGLTHSDAAAQAALIARQIATANALPDVFSLSAMATAPFTTGLGNEHPLENGFAFLSPYGLPYLPGSGVKGVLREAARQLSSGEWEDDQGWGSTASFRVQTGAESIALSCADVLFGLQSDDGATDHVRGVLNFWDVIPSLPGGRLAVDIMTPHQSAYYQQTDKGGFTSPHDSGQPNPIQFLTVPPGANFHFHVRCDIDRLRALAPALAVDDRWQALLRTAFEHAFSWLGFGAKTAVGYGAMISDAQASHLRHEREQQIQADKVERAARDEARQETAAAAVPGLQVKFNRRSGALTVEEEKSGKQLAIAISPKGEALLKSLPPDLQAKIRGGGFVRVTAYVAEGALVRVEKS